MCENYEKLRLSSFFFISFFPFGEMSFVDFLFFFFSFPCYYKVKKRTRKWREVSFFDQRWKRVSERSRSVHRLAIRPVTKKLIGVDDG